MSLKRTPTQMRPAEVREPGLTAEGLEEYLAFRADTDLRWPYAVPPDYLAGTQGGAEHAARGAEAPLIVFINARSGGRAGPALATALSHALGRAQVFDLTQHRPDRVLARIWQNLQEAEARGDARAAATRAKLRVVACGGDGTVAWILKSVASLGLQPPPAVAVVPLGTGNDLSRTFGWGAAYSHAWFTGYQATYKSLRRFAEAPPANLDRWRLRLCVPDGAQFLPSSTYAVADPGDGGERALAAASRQAAQTIAEVVLDAQRQQQLSLGGAAAAAAAGGGNGGGGSGNGHGGGGSVPTSSAGAYPMSPLSGARVHPPAGWRPAAREGTFWNYFSVGADALAAFRFHHMRDSNPSCAGSRLANQFWYSWFSCSSGWFAPHVACARDVPPVARFVAVEVLDAAAASSSSSPPVEGGGGDAGAGAPVWRPLTLPASIRAVVVVNLQSYGGGRNIWGAGAPNPAAPPKAGNGGGGGSFGGGGGGGGWQPAVNLAPSASDGVFEVVGFASGYHAMAVMASNARVAHGVRLAQASGVRIALKAAVPQPDGSPGRVYLQMDGEPWEQPVPSGAGEPPVVVEIVHDGVSRVLSNKARGGDLAAGVTAAGARADGGPGGGADARAPSAYSLGGGAPAPAASSGLAPELQEQYLEEISGAKEPMSPMTVPLEDAPAAGGSWFGGWRSGGGGGSKPASGAGGAPA